MHNGAKYYDMICYRNVMGDITRLLFLLNKKPANIEMPPDGMQLLEWSEQTLQHYLDSQVRNLCHVP